MNVFTLASRNVYRNRLRSLVTTLAMAFACFIMILFSTLMEGMILGSERQVVEMNMGDIQIHQTGYLEEPDIYTTIPNTSAILNTLQQHGFHAAPRLYASGLLAANMASAGVQLRGIDLTHEKQVTKLFEHVETGRWLSEDKKMSVVLGKKLAATLGVALGDELVFIGQSADGYMANDIFYVQGILKSVADGIDRTAVFMLADSFRELMVTPEGAHEIVVIRNDRTIAIENATTHVKALVPDAEVKNWKELMPVVAQMLETANAQTIIMLIITYIAVATIILNAMLMTVFERIHEYGIMKAIGVRPWQIVRLIYTETLIQALLASSIALIFGWWVSYYFERDGIDMSSFAETSISFGGIAFDPIWYAHITPSAIFIPIAFLILIALLAVIYPATKAAVIKPIDAIYFQ
ncbi:MAG: FtsX-like permease family protein [Mariprofundales bacterium]